MNLNLLLADLQNAAVWTLKWQIQSEYGNTAAAKIIADQCFFFFFHGSQGESLVGDSLHTRKDAFFFSVFLCFSLTSDRCRHVGAYKLYSC